MHKAVVSEAGVLVGQAMCYGVSSGGTSARIAVDILPEMRGQGFAKSSSAQLATLLVRSYGFRKLTFHLLTREPERVQKACVDPWIFEGFLPYAEKVGMTPYSLVYGAFFGGSIP